MTEDVCDVDWVFLTPLAALPQAVVPARETSDDERHCDVHDVFHVFYPLALGPAVVYHSNGGVNLSSTYRLRE